MEEKWRKEYEAWTIKDISFNMVIDNLWPGYLEACKKRQVEIDELKEIIRDLGYGYKL